MARISLIVPCYNVAHEIDETLESIRGQTVGEWEAVLVNDGSTDATADCLRAFAAREPRARIIDQANAGLAAARNAGLAAATADRVLFLDAGDVLEPGALAGLSGILDREPEVGAACGSWRYVGPQGEDCDWIATPPKSHLRFPDFVRYNPINIDVVLVRREWIQPTSAFDESMFCATCEDWDFWAQLARNGCLFRATSEPMVRYRMMPGSGSRDITRMLEAGLTTIRRIHRPDSRCPRAAAVFAPGAPAAGLAAAMADWSTFCVASAYAQGGGSAGQHILRRAREGLEAVLTLEPILLARYLHFAIPYHTCRFPSCWPELWPDQCGTLERWLSEVEQYLSLPGFAAACAGHLRQLVGNVEIADRLLRVVQVNRSSKRVVVYGRGRNGQELLRRLDRLGISAEVADDVDGMGGIDRFLSSLEDQLIVVTPWENERMCRRLASAGAKHKRHFVTWSDFSPEFAAGGTGN